MGKLENDIKRYLAGEMTPEEQHVLEKKALSDPFLYEALEGVHSISEQELNADLDELSFRIKERSREKIQAEFAAGAVASQRFSKAASVESIAAEPIKKNKNKWAWPLRIAASLALLAVAYFAITPFFEKEEQLASKEQKFESDSIQKKSLIDSTNKGDGLIALSEKKVEKPNEKSAKAKGVVTEQKPKTEVNSKMAEVQPLQAAKAEGVVVDEKISADQVADLITESPVVAAQEKQAELKKEAAPQGARSKSVASGVIANQKVIQGKVLSADDGTPLPGVNIVIKGTTTGTVTDMQGAYKIVSDVQQPTLVYSFIGLQSTEVKVTDQKEVTVNLQPDVSQLSEVVVTGYSSVKDLDHEPVVRLAEPEGGRRAYDKYLKSSLQYPQEAIDNKIKGRVTILFTVATDGSLSEFTVFKGLGFGCDEEVIRLVKEGPKWAPTMEDNVAVESEVRVRVKFALPN